MSSASEQLVILQGIKKYYPIPEGIFSKRMRWLKALDGVDLTIGHGETVGLVGESGCGKSTLGRLILRLEDATEGTIWFDGRYIQDLKKKELRTLRKRMQIIFQDPYSSLDPRRTVGSLIGEAFVVHHVGLRKEREERVLQLLRDVGMRPEHMPRFPHQFSGGQRQRIGIARALSLNPKLVICDEPVSSLDVSVQAQVINLLQDLQQKYNLSYLFISHALSVISHICDRVAVMYLGQIVELGDRDALFQAPLHPYTQALLSASPSSSSQSSHKRIILEGEIPSPMEPPSGCYFHTRCPKTSDLCRRDTPHLLTVKGTHQVRCFLHM